MIHESAHPDAGSVVKVHPKSKDHQLLVDGAEFQIEDYWDRVSGGSWMDAQGNPAALNYAVRTGLSEEPIPTDDEVVYGKIGPLGYLVHTSELGEVLASARG